MNTPSTIQTSPVKSVGGRVQINSSDNAVIHSNATNVYQATSKRYCHTANVLGCVTSRHSITQHAGSTAARSHTKQHRTATTSQRQSNQLFNGAHTKIIFILHLHLQ